MFINIQNRQSVPARRSQNRRSATGSVDSKPAEAPRSLLPSGNGRSDCEPLREVIESKFGQGLHPRRIFRIGGREGLYRQLLERDAVCAAAGENPRTALSRDRCNRRSLAWGGILEAWAFENSTETTRVAKMAKSRDSAKERYWRGVIRRFEAVVWEPGGFASGKGSPSTAAIGGGEHYDSVVQPSSDVRGADRKRGRSMTAAISRRESSFLPVAFPFLSGARSKSFIRVGIVIRVPAIFDQAALGNILAVIDASAGTSGEQ